MLPDLYHLFARFNQQAAIAAERAERETTRGRREAGEYYHGQEVAYTLAANEVLRILTTAECAPST